MPTPTRPLALITAPFDDAVAASLEADFDLRIHPAVLDGKSLISMGLDDELREASVIVAELDEVDQATFDAAPQLELVVSCRAKPVNVDLAAADARGVAVSTTPARNAEVTADLSFALLMATVRHVSASERWLRAGHWKASDVFEPYETFRSIGLNGRTLGVLGGGAVGSRVVRRARGFGMNVMVYDPFLPADHFGSEATVAPLDEVLAAADIVTVHVPLFPDTVNLIGARELALMKPSAFFINAGRAAIVNEEALFEALSERRLAGAGFDVFYEEPLPHDSRWFALDNVTMTPHIAGASDDVIAEHSRMAAQAMQAWRAGAEVPFPARRG